MKKLINQPDDFVRESLEGMAVAHPDLIKVNFTPIADLCTRVNSYGRSMGVALTSCTLPAKGSPTFEISDTFGELRLTRNLNGLRHSFLTRKGTHVNSSGG